MTVKEIGWYKKPTDGNQVENPVGCKDRVRRGHE